MSERVLLDIERRTGRSVGRALTDPIANVSNEGVFNVGRQQRTSSERHIGQGIHHLEDVADGAAHRDMYSLPQEEVLWELHILQNEDISTVVDVDEKSRCYRVRWPSQMDHGQQRFFLVA